jgi:hypothetical protein
MESTSNNEYYRKLSQQIAQKDNLIRLLRMQLDKQKEDVEDEDLSLQIIDLREELNETIVKLEDANSSNQTLKSECEELKSLPKTALNVGDENIKIDELEAECENLHDKLSYLKKENGKLTREVEDKNGYIEILKGEIKELKEKSISVESNNNVTTEYAPNSTDDILNRIENKLNEYDIKGRNIDDVKKLLNSLTPSNNSGVDILLREKDNEINRLKIELREPDSGSLEKKHLQEKIDMLNGELKVLRKSSNKGSSGSSLSLVYNIIQIIDGFLQNDIQVLLIFNISLHHLKLKIKY